MSYSLYGDWGSTSRFALYELVVQAKLAPPSEPDNSKQECRKWNRVFAKDRKRRRKGHK